MARPAVPSGCGSAYCPPCHPADSPAGGPWVLRPLPMPGSLCSPRLFGALLRAVNPLPSTLPLPVILVSFRGSPLRSPCSKEGFSWSHLLSEAASGIGGHSGGSPQGGCGLCVEQRPWPPGFVLGHPWRARHTLRVWTGVRISVRGKHSLAGRLWGPSRRSLAAVPPSLPFKGVLGWLGL